jgi:hypothetical protein
MKEKTYSVVSDSSSASSTIFRMPLVTKAWMLHMACTVLPKCCPWCTSRSLARLSTVNRSSWGQRNVKDNGTTTYGFFLGPNERALTGLAAVPVGGSSSAGMIDWYCSKDETRAASKHYLSEFKPEKWVKASHWWDESYLKWLSDRDGIAPYYISWQTVTPNEFGIKRMPALSKVWLTTIIPNGHQKLLRELREDTWNIRSSDPATWTLVILPWYVYVS